MSSLVTRPLGHVGPVAVEYAVRLRAGKVIRRRKILPDMWAARRFYVAKFKAGADPRIVKLEEQR